MIRHILLLQKRAASTPSSVDAARDGLAALVGVIPGLVNFHWGANIGPAERSDGFTHGFTMDFTDQSSLDAYGPNPTHQVAAARVREVFERIAVFDFTLQAAVDSSGH
jgi:hypothetical protein